MNAGSEALDVGVTPAAVSTLEAQPPAAESTLEAQPPEPVVITVHEVAFSTAAAVPVRRSTLHRWAEAAFGVLAALDRKFLPSEAKARAPRHDQPRRYRYIEDSRMCREMDRL